MSDLCLFAATGLGRLICHLHKKIAKAASTFHLKYSLVLRDYSIFPSRITTASMELNCADIVQCFIIIQCRYTDPTITFLAVHNSNKLYNWAEVYATLNVPPTACCRQNWDFTIQHDKIYVTSTSLECYFLKNFKCLLMNLDTRQTNKLGKG